MDFISPPFLFLFLPLFVLIYSLVRNKLRLLIGIISSIVFYAWGNFFYIFLILGLVIFSYLIGSWINSSQNNKTSAYILWGGVLIILITLIFFKLNKDVIYPLGLSYIIFQIISYFIDVHKNKDVYEKDILKFSFYLLLFPKILVGPIVRYTQVKKQLDSLQTKSEDMADGLRRFLKGFIKKALIADTLGTIVTPIFDLQSPVITPGIAWLVIISYSLQIYYDFSGYTDMAIGLGRMMGLSFMENFNFPYLAKNISDFWRRWHISLSTWFRDYVFYPLERRRLKWIGLEINILIVFALTGLWHGFMRNFFIWGLIHGIALVFEASSLGRKFRSSWIPIQHLYTLGVIIVGWVFFRSPTPDFALDFIRRLLGDTRGIQMLPFELTSPLPFIEPTFVLILVVALITLFPIGIWVQEKFERILKTREYLRLPFQLGYDISLFLIFLLSLASIASSSYNPGIYGAF